MYNSVVASRNYKFPLQIGQLTESIKWEKYLPTANIHILIPSMYDTASVYFVTYTTKIKKCSQIYHTWIVWDFFLGWRVKIRFATFNFHNPIMMYLSAGKLKWLERTSYFFEDKKQTIHMHKWQNKYNYEKKTLWLTGPFPSGNYLILVCVLCPPCKKVMVLLMIINGDSENLTMPFCGANSFLWFNKYK